MKSDDEKNEEKMETGQCSRWSRPVATLSLVAMTSMFDLGYSNAYPNTALNNFRHFINESMMYDDGGSESIDSVSFRWTWAAILNVWFLGNIVGSAITPIVAEKQGRKVGLIVGSMLNIAGTSVAVVAIAIHKPYLMGIGRFIVGLGCGLNNICVTLLLQESSPTPIRGLISSVQELAVCVTSLIGIISGLSYVLGANLIYLIAIPIAIDTVTICSSIVYHDSPKYLLLRKANEPAAAASIRFYHGSNANVKLALSQIAMEVDDGDQSLLRRLATIWSEKHLRKATAIGCVAIVSQVTTGIFPITALSSEFFVGAGLTQSLAEWGSVAMVFINTIGTILSMFLVDRFGRRPMLLGLCLTTTACLCAYSGFAFSQRQFGFDPAKYGALASMLLFALCFSLGPGPIPWFICAELVPTSVRGTVQCIGMICLMSVNLLISTFTLPLYEDIGELTFILLFAVPTLVCTTILYKYLPETKNREIADIVARFKGVDLATEQRRAAEQMPASNLDKDKY